ncbi:MAG: phosphoribosylformylglycinamidine synthase subunit PurQ [Actinobacteria bacterium]|nr:phosphoribosylformylglycinamidine synthase subunit PurQ [Actinomycetota bacterium]
MADPKFGIVVFPGSNCDVDCYYALKSVLKADVRLIWHQEREIGDLDCIILPGGFSYGDYLRCGSIARFSPVMDDVIKFSENGGLVLGICNGFQTLAEAHLLPGALIRNRGLKFICDFVHLRVENNRTPFTMNFEKGQVIKLVIKHNEGNYQASDSVISELKSSDQILLRYCDEGGNVGGGANPNGAKDSIAGMVNKNGNIFGLMPHPENCCEAVLGSNDGMGIFSSIISYIKESG